MSVVRFLTRQWRQIRPPTQWELIGADTLDGAQAAKRKRVKRDELAAEKAAAAYAAAQQACRPVHFRMRIVGGVVRCYVTTSMALLHLDLDHYLARKCRGGRPRNDGTLSGVAGAYEGHVVPVPTMRIVGRENSMNMCSIVSRVYTTRLQNQSHSPKVIQEMQVITCPRTCGMSLFWGA